MWRLSSCACRTSGAVVADDGRTGCALDGAVPSNAARETSRDVEDGGATVHRTGRGPCAARRCTMAPMARDFAAHVVAACVASRRAISMVAPPPAGRRSGESPVSLRRCRDGWSDFF
ncbi:spartin-like [Dorcoceras hygrometricum]|uniref:Spartin-like n=1 Tax=Dorcoceras hygrometricum TaxID=472368 RepID=A0A2Z7C730_9LAMI|nr:spartin-like [Dorcoceras hygrometricum]